MNRKILLPTVIAFAALGFTSVQAQQVYRWVDSQGHVHYSQTPPPNAASKAQLLDVQAPPPDVTAAREQRALVKTMQAKNAARQKAAAEAQAAAEKKARRQQACAAARAQLQQYLQAHRVITNGNSTNPSYYTGEDLVKFRQQAQEQVNKLCAGS